MFVICLPSETCIKESWTQIKSLLVTNDFPICGEMCLRSAMYFSVLRLSKSPQASETWAVLKSDGLMTYLEDGAGQTA